MRKRKRKLVDPLQFEMSIQAEDLTGYVLVLDGKWGRLQVNKFQH